MFALAATLLFLLLGCQKEMPSPTLTTNQPPAQATPREGDFEADIQWLQAYQADLASAINSNSMSQTYSYEQMAAGAEALINVATISNKPRSLHQSKVTYFKVGASTNAKVLKGIYQGAYSAYRTHWLSTDTTQTVPVVIEVSIAGESPTGLNIKATTIVGVCNTCLLAHYTVAGPDECADAFEPTEAFRVGGGDEELSMANSYLNPMCNQACGTTPACVSGPSTAYEAIEARLNFNYAANHPPCGFGQMFQGYINVTGPLFAYPLDFLEDDCENTPSQLVGTCMGDTDLNCAYCSLYEQIGVEPFLCSARKKFISLNLAVYYCVCGVNSECEYIASVRAEYYSGTPVCTTVPQPPGWNNPVLVDLTNLDTP
jgi:hypothetical protein